MLVLAAGQASITYCEFKLAGDVGHEVAFVAFVQAASDSGAEVVVTLALLHCLVALGDQVVLAAQRIPEGWGE
tara:strand:+ start:329 stop:547 length:219 start_codon:yes stop_codon:yes gene_type:complete